MGLVLSSNDVNRDAIQTAREGLGAVNIINQRAENDASFWLNCPLTHGASGAGGTATETATVTVLNPPTVTISDIGPVDANGTIAVTPDRMRTYTIEATGAGGTSSATANENPDPAQSGVIILYRDPVE